jgi:cytochrome d ubiquinol oxidase subunit II
LLTRSWAIPFQLFTGITAVTTIVALLRRRYAVARIAAGAQVSALMWGWAGAQFPALVPGVHTIESAAAPFITLKLVSIGLVGGAVVLVPSLWYLFRVFKSDTTSAFERVDTAEYRAPRD